MTDFEGVVPALVAALTKRGYSALTPVQRAVLAPEVSTSDALVSAQTGSGKTVAFGLTLAPGLLDGNDRFSPAEAPLALVVAPTRELALQVRREFEWLYELTGASIASCVGGMDMRDERRALARGAHIVVGTPGRLRDHIQRGSLDMSRLRAVVLDEADEMLDLGFREDLEFILEAAPAERRTLMFSATVPRTIANLAKRYQRDALRISTQAEESQHVDIEYRALSVATSDRENAIINVLRYYEAKNALVFCGTRAMVNHMTSRFTNRGFAVVALSGELSQNERTHALQAMRDGRARVCIATDVAARGIDLPNLELVIHAELPKTSETLLHRSGRTGRAGRKGVCVLIVPGNARHRAQRLLRDAKVEADWASAPSADEVTARDDQRIMADPGFADPIREDEVTMVREMVARHSPEQVAAALLRLHRAGRSAPEDLSVIAPFDAGRSGDSARSDAPRKPRDSFTGGVWFSLSLGRKHNAEPRWLIPILCRTGGFSKAEIGSIRIQDSETLVEIDPKCVDQFVKALGPGMQMEKSIAVTRLDGIPAGAHARREKTYVKKNFNRDHGRENTSGAEPDARPKPVKAKWERPAHQEKRPAAPTAEAYKPKPTKSEKPEARKPFKPKFDKAGGKGFVAGKPAADGVKKKKPKKPRAK